MSIHAIDPITQREVRDRRARLDVRDLRPRQAISTNLPVTRGSGGRHARLALSACLILVLSVLSTACSENTAAPNPGIAGPVAVVAAPSGYPEADGTLVVVANANTEDLRAFVPATGLFVRGPNAISPLSIPVGFRPQRLAPGSIDSGGSTLGFVVVGGPSNRLVALDTQDLRVRASAAEEALCGSGTVSAACLPAAVRDVVVAGDRVFAVVGAGDGGGASFVSGTVVDEEGSPVVRLDSVTDIGGDPSSLAVLPDGSRAFVGDGATGEVRVIDPAAPSTTLSEIRAAGPVRRLLAVPEYVSETGDTRPAGEYLLALLSDGTVQTLDPATGAPAASPLVPSDDIVPLSFTAPVLDLQFVPCDLTSPVIDCSTELRISASETLSLPLVAFAALGDGSAVALVPDADSPQVFRPINRTTADPSAGSVSYDDDGSPEDGPVDVPTLELDPDSFTEGVTRSEVISVRHRGVLPGLTQRVAELDGSGASLSLTDAQGNLTSGDRLRVGDEVRLTGVTAECAELESTLTAEVASISDDVLGLTSLSREIPSSCLPASVLFEVRASGDAPWVVEGSATGFLGRAAQEERFEATPPRFVYPDDGEDGPAFAFTIEGASPEAPGARFSFTTTSGFTPLRISAESTDFTLANGVAAVPGRIFVALIGGDALLDARLGQLTQAGAVRVYREITVRGAVSSGAFGSF